MDFQMAIRTVIGLMSGTSMDGIDVALVKTDGKSLVERGPMGFYPYTSSARELLEQAILDASNLDNRSDRPGCLMVAEREITKLHANAVQSFLDDNNLKPDDIDLLGFHGQTVLHRPDEGLTVQLGDGQKLANQTRINTVYDMRANDMLNGGQGAPLVPVYHQALAASLPEGYREHKPVVFVNIGGISNITYVGEELVAFDSGPGNALIDQWVQSRAGVPYDQGGMIAAKGDINHALANHYLENDYFQKALPKSLDRNDFLPPEPDALGVEDGARTLAHVTARAIMKSVDQLPQSPRLWIICGGGRLNPHIMNDLTALATESDAKVIKAEEAGFDGDAMEAECWGYLAVRCAEFLPITFPMTTGVKEPVTGGTIARA